MARKHAYRNDRISADPFTDLGGETAVPANAGELRLGDDAEFLGHQSINTDGTLSDYPVEDEKISQYISCSCCGLIVTKRNQLTKNANGRLVCKDCIQDDLDPRR